MTGVLPTTGILPVVPVVRLVAVIQRVRTPLSVMRSVYLYSCFKSVLYKYSVGNRVLSLVARVIVVYPGLFQ